MTDNLNYKNYEAAINFSAEDNVFHGRISGIDDLITFEGYSIPELKNAFQEAVDDYIETCNLIGK